MIDHFGIDVSDFGASKAFYDAALGPLGLAFVFMVPPEHTGGARVGRFGAGRAEFWISEADRASSPIHFAFAAATRQQVRDFHAAALAAGGRDNGAPGLRPHYHSGYYGAFVLDPDGNNVEAVCHSPG
nr:VOC family protein [Jannaschia aquimarina]